MRCKWLNVKSANLCKLECLRFAFCACCGKRGIRTLGTRKGTTVFETVPIDHSGIFPMVFSFRGAKVGKRIKQQAN